MQKHIGICALCGENSKLSFEHVPPQSAFNDKPIYIQTFENLFNHNSHFFKKRMRSNRGFGDYTLCDKCNKLTGGWYANDFTDFAHQGMSIIQNHNKGSQFIKGTYQIKPLNIIKEIITIFMSADRLGYLRSQKKLVDFVLNRDMIGLSEEYSIYLYSTLSTLKRKLGYHVVYDQNLGLQNWCEFNFQPFGYLFADRSGPAHKDMLNISTFGNYKYDEETTIELTTPYLPVNSLIIGTYF